MRVLIVIASAAAVIMPLTVFVLRPPAPPQPCSALRENVELCIADHMLRSGTPGR